MTVEPIVLISALEHHLYCPRQCALIHVDGVWVDNPHTLRGQAGHIRADTGASRTERGRQVLRGVPLWSEALGLAGRADVIEVSPSGALTPVEYKMGVRHGRAGDVQLCAQALCLEEMTRVAVVEGVLWLAALRRRTRVSLDEELRDITRRAIDEVRGWLRAERLPPAVNDSRCSPCQ